MIIHLFIFHTHLFGISGSQGSAGAYPSSHRAEAGHQEVMIYFIVFLFFGVTIREDSVCLSSRWQQIRALALWSERGSGCSAPPADAVLRHLQVWRRRISQRVSAVLPPSIIRFTIITPCTHGRHICFSICQVSVKPEQVSPKQTEFLKTQSSCC